MSRRLLLALFVFSSACGSSEDPVVDAGFPDAAYDGGFGPDVGFRDTGPRDFGSRPDAGFADPATLLEGKEEIGGIRLQLQVRGTLTSTMPPVLLISTGPMHGLEYWVEPMSFLLGPGGATDPDRLLFFFDLRATGQSSFGAIGTSSITVAGHQLDVENMIGFVRAFSGKTGPVDLIGHGYGAALAAMHAHNHPSDVSRLVMIDPFPIDIVAHADWRGAYNARLSSDDQRQLIQVTQWMTCLMDLGRCAREVWRIIGPTWVCRENREILQQMRFENLEARAFQYFIPTDLRELQYDWRDDVGNIRAPTTLLWGACDPIPAGSFEAWRSSIPNVTTFTSSVSGHFPMTEHAPWFQRIVRRALTY